MFSLTASEASTSSSPPPNSHLHGQVNISAHEYAWKELYRSVKLIVKVEHSCWRNPEQSCHSSRPKTMLFFSQVLQTSLSDSSCEAATLPPYLPFPGTQVCISDWFRLVLVKRRVIIDLYSLMAYKVIFFNLNLFLQPLLILLSLTGAEASSSLLLSSQ